MQTDNTPIPTLIKVGAEQIAGLCDSACNVYIAEHIRGIVAATLGNLSVRGSNVLRDDAEQWHHWALGVADGLVVPS